jgi:hypothetical protein
MSDRSQDSNVAMTIAAITNAAATHSFFTHAPS